MDNLINKIFGYGKSKDISDMEIYFVENESLSMNVYSGELDKYNMSKTMGLSFRCIYNNKMGYSYTEKIDETSIEFLVNSAMSNSQIVDCEDEEFIYSGANKEDYMPVNNYNPSYDKISQTDKLNFIKSMEKYAKKLDKRIVSVNYCSFGESKVHKILANSKGLRLEDKYNIAHSYVYVTGKDGDDIKTAYKFVIGNDFEKFNYKTLAKDAVTEVISMFKASSIKSGSYPIVLNNLCAASLLEAFSGIFSSENVQKNLSLLKGRLNDLIANEDITIVDNPFLLGGIGSSSFDGEGHPCSYKELVKKGKLMGYLYNLKTAKKDNTVSTGNASRGSFKSTIDISPTNLYIKEGSSSLKALVKSVKCGILITDLQGLHSGVNPISGDFSLSAQGYEIIGGKIKRPINQITIAGNFLEMLKDVELIGDDLEFGFGSNIGSPSLKIKGLAVSGE